MFWGRSGKKLLHTNRCQWKSWWCSWSFDITGLLGHSHAQSLQIHHIFTWSYSLNALLLGSNVNWTLKQKLPVNDPAFLSTEGLSPFCETVGRKGNADYFAKRNTVVKDKQPIYFFSAAWIPERALYNHGGISHHRWLHIFLYCSSLSSTRQYQIQRKHGVFNSLYTVLLDH